MKINTKILIFVSLAIVMFMSCESKRDALGVDNELIVICSEVDKPAMRDFVNAILDDTLFTPQPEPYFKIRFVAPSAYADLKRQAYVLVGALGDDPYNDGVSLVKKLLPEAQYKKTQANDPILFSKDLFALNQIFMMVNAKDKDHLMSAVASKKEWIQKKFSDQFAKRQDKFLFQNARRLEVEDTLSQKYGWTLKIPWGWEVLRDSSELGFFWLGREMPYQWISVQWEEGKTIDEVNDLDIGQKVWAYPENFYDHIRFHEYKFKMEKVYFHQRKAWKITGIWESIEEAQGGPFLSYIFYDKALDKTFHLNMLMYHPGREKTIFMGQLDLIAKSFTVTKK